VSLDSLRSQPMQAPSSPISPKIPYYNPIGLTIGQMSPTSPQSAWHDAPLTPRGTDSKAQSFNAVHMHVQENAKLPTFNLNVDRTNSSHVSRTAPSYTKATENNSRDPADDLFQIEERDFSMAELFLSKESSHRHSLNQNYENVSALKKSLLGDDHAAKPSSSSSVLGRQTSSSNASAGGTEANNAARDEKSAAQMEIDALTAAIDPTPWSEMQQKIGGGNSNSNTNSNSFASATANHPHGYNYYPYGRHQQLPMYEKLHSPLGAQQSPPSPETAVPANNGDGLISHTDTTTSTLAQAAVATAAQIASTVYHSPRPTSTSPTASAPASAPMPFLSHKSSLRPNSPSSEPQALSQAPSREQSDTGNVQKLARPQSHPQPTGRATMKVPPKRASASMMTMSLPNLAPSHPRRAAATAAVATKPIHHRTTPTAIAPNPGLPLVDGNAASASTCAGTGTGASHARNATVSANTNENSNTSGSTTGPKQGTQQRSYINIHSRPNFTAPKHSTAHSQNRASVAAAAKKKTQYGFGGNHVVPSVPGPPPADPKNAKSTSLAPSYRGGAMTSNARRKAAATAPSKSKLASRPRPPSIPVLSTNSSSNADANSITTVANSGAAYERKKERAKMARVKLNESIERLSVAISLAASQSRQRKKDIASMPPCETRERTLHNMSECVRISDQAKKWDRPSFVGTAASLIQNLNSQCEELMREVASLQARLDGAAVVRDGNNSSDANTVTPASSVGCKRPGESDWSDEQGQAATRLKSASLKRAKIEEEQRQQTQQQEQQIGNDAADIPNEIANIEISNIRREHQTIVFRNVAKLLDPVSLSRCNAVSREWKGLGIFDDESVWLNLSMRRFGFKNVREWTERLNDAGENVATTRPFNKTVYKRMAQATVMPHFQHQGWKFLGKAMIPGRAAGWAFTVERSNGETLRSVLKEPASKTMPSRSQFASLPVVELRIILQNIGSCTQVLAVKDQPVTIDTSTRRSGGEWEEIMWDPRFSKLGRDLNNNVLQKPTNGSTYNQGGGDLCHISLFETAILEVFIHARGCSTISRFEQRGNFAKVLIGLDGTTIPFVIPFFRDAPNGSDGLM